MKVADYAEAVTYLGPIQAVVNYSATRLPR
jgi:hypothetical protein